MELHYQCVHLALLLEEIYIIFNKPYQTIRKIPLATQWQSFTVDHLSVSDF